MTATVASFRGAFPEFSDALIYPVSEIEFWQGLATKLLNASRWGTVLDEGIYLFTAHNLSLEFNAKQAAQTGNNPGFVIGPVTSGSVDKVSYSRDASAAMDPANGHWNLSIYGIRYIRLANMMGAGPIQAGLPCGGYEVGAWPGVLYPEAWQG